MRRFHGVTTKNLPNCLGWHKTLKAMDHDATEANWMLGRWGSGHTNK